MATKPAEGRPEGAFRSRGRRGQEDEEEARQRDAAQALLVLQAGHQGDVKGDRPGGFELVGGAKYDAWAKFKGTGATRR